MPHNMHNLPTELSYSVGYVYSTTMKSHKNTLNADHVERPLRIDKIYQKLLKEGFIGEMKQIKFRLATREEVLRIHTADLWDRVESIASMSKEEIIETEDDYEEMSLYVCPGTSRAARFSCGGVIEAALYVAQGEVDRSFAIVRPPGHHAEPGEHKGFCFYNNVAVAAKAVQEHTNLGKILIVDWDIHHGNGTHLAFEDDPSVLYISIHRYEDGHFYPKGPLGGMKSCGTGDGLGYSVNIPWTKSGMGDADYLYAFDSIVMPIATEFDPDLVIVSAGFDAAEGDPLGECNVTPDGFAHMTYKLCKLAAGRIVVALEGGYNLESMSNSAAAVVRVLIGERPQMEDLPVLSPSAAKVIWQVSLEQRKYWKDLRSSWSHLDQSLRQKNLTKKERTSILQEAWMTWDLKQVGIPGVDYHDSDMWNIWLNTTRETANTYLKSILTDLYTGKGNIYINSRIEKSIAGRAHRGQGVI